MCEQGGVGGHVHNIGIALDASYEGGFVDAGTCVVPLLTAVVACIFTGKHFRTCAVVTVVAVPLVLEPRDGTIEVFVDEVGLLALHGFPTNLEVVTLGVGTAGADDTYLGMCLADSVGNYLHTLEVGLVPLLVANAKKFPVEGCGMTHVGSQFPPLGID